MTIFFIILFYPSSRLQIFCISSILEKTVTLYKHGRTMNQISRMLAWRYVTGSIYERSVSIMVIISFIGIFIGSCALALLLPSCMALIVKRANRCKEFIRKQ